MEKPDSVPLKVNKTTDTQEYSDSKTSKQDEISINDNKQTAERRKVDTEHKDMNVERIS